MEYKIAFTPNNCKDGMGNLQMRVRWATNTLTMNVGYLVTLDKWDRELQLCKNNTSHGKKKILATEINKAIRRHKVAVSEASCAFLPTYAPTVSELRSGILTALGKEDKAAISKMENVVPVITQFIIKESMLNSWSQNTEKKFRTLKDTIVRWKENATLADFNTEGLESFYAFLLDEGKVNTTIEKYIVNLKSFLRWVDKKTDYSVPKDYETFKPRIKTIPKTIVWLSWDELLRLYDADLSTLLHRKYEDSDNEVRDIFCLSCFTGMRFSDIHNLRHSDIINNKIQLNITKTSEDVTIELNKYARAILLRYADADPVFAMPRTSNPVCNRSIKEICRALEICAPTTIKYYKGNERIQEQKPKCELITMHTGRRTFICSALEKGISPLVVMKWTGHKDYEEMSPYIDISDKAKESAMKLFDL